MIWPIILHSGKTATWWAKQKVRISGVVPLYPSANQLYRINSLITRQMRASKGAATGYSVSPIRIVCVNQPKEIGFRTREIVEVGSIILKLRIPKTVRNVNGSQA